MKRSEINKILMQTEEFLKVCKFNLPEWAFWDITAWKQKKDDISHILQSNLGWDITDFGSNDFSRRGLFLFTLRNGMGGVTSKKPYAEKVLVVKVNQETPQHRHALKREDIINRNGGDLIVQVWNALPDNTGICSVSDVSIAVDSVYRIVPAGGRVVLKPGQSVYLENHHYHSFFAEKETVLAMKTTNGWEPGNFSSSKQITHRTLRRLSQNPRLF